MIKTKVFKTKKEACVWYHKEMFTLTYIQLLMESKKFNSYFKGEIVKLLKGYLHRELSIAELEEELEFLDLHLDVNYPPMNIMHIKKDNKFAVSYNTQAGTFKIVDGRQLA